MFLPDAAAIHRFTDSLARSLADIRDVLAVRGKGER
jgi:hypothetical protein